MTPLSYHSSNLLLTALETMRLLVQTEGIETKSMISEQFFYFPDFSGFWNFKNRSAILVIIFWHFLIIQLTSESAQVKRYLISAVTNLVHKLPHELPNDLRLTILGNQEILEKCQMWVQTQPNAQSSFQKLNVDNSCQKTRKIRYYIFETLPNFIVSLHFLLNILSRIVVVNLNKHF